jgi:hypothetical protein
MSNLRNILIPCVLLLSLVGVGCSNKNETVECDQTKFDCTPKTEPTETIASEPTAISEAVANDSSIQTANENIPTDSDDIVKNKYGINKETVDHIGKVLTEKQFSELMVMVDDGISFNLKGFDLTDVSLGSDYDYDGYIKFTSGNSPVVTCDIRVKMIDEEGGVDIYFPDNGNACIKKSVDVGIIVL